MRSSHRSLAPAFIRQLLVRAMSGTWGEAIDAFMALQRGPVALAELYRVFATHPKTSRNKHWQDKIRQVLQERGYRRVEKGVWAS